MYLQGDNSFGFECSGMEPLVYHTCPVSSLTSCVRNYKETSYEISLLVGYSCGRDGM